MFIRVSWGKLKPGAWSEYERTYEDQVRSGGSIEGLRRRVLARDVDEPNAGYTISFWEDEKSMRAHETSSRLQTMLEQLQPYFTGEYTQHRCELRVDDAELSSSSQPGRSSTPR